MSIEVKTISIIFVLLVAGVVYWVLIKEHNEQKGLIKSKNYRREHGILLLSNYIGNKAYVKEYKWKFQKNKGKHPCKLKKAINLRNYSDDCQFIVCKKGL